MILVLIDATWIVFVSTNRGLERDLWKDQCISRSTKARTWSWGTGCWHRNCSRYLQDFTITSQDMSDMHVRARRGRVLLAYQKARNGETTLHSPVLDNCLLRALSWMQQHKFSLAQMLIVMEREQRICQPLSALFLMTIIHPLEQCVPTVSHIRSTTA